MALSDLKFSAAEFAGRDVASLPDQPSAAGITAAQLKARFDSVGKAMLALDRYNALIDALSATDVGSSGAEQIGVAAIQGLAGDTVQALLAALASLRHSHSNKAVLDMLSDALGTDVYLNGAGGYSVPPGASALSELRRRYPLYTGSEPPVAPGELVYAISLSEASWRPLCAGSVLYTGARLGMAALAAATGQMLSAIEHGQLSIDCGSSSPSPYYSGTLYTEGTLNNSGAFTVVTPRTCTLREGYDYWRIGVAELTFEGELGGAARYSQNFFFDASARLILHYGGGGFTALDGVPLTVGG